MRNFDLIIIGGGEGGFASAIKANELGAKTLMINSGLPLGGTCVNVGCVPTKFLVAVGEFLHHCKAKSFDFEKIIEGELKLVNNLRRDRYDKVLKSLEKVEFIEGKAKFISPKEILVNQKKFSAEKFIIATGSTANVPPIKGIKEAGYLTHIEALKITKQPKSMAVIGAGPVGLEFSQMYSRFKTKVTLLEAGPNIFPPAEPELTERLAEIFKKEGIKIETGAKVEKVEKSKSGKIISYLRNNKKEKIKVEEILLAAGKTANTEYLDLEKAGVKINERKAILVNSYFQTSAPHIFAVGDVIALPLRLEMTAAREGTLATENALLGTKKTIDYNSVPYTIFIDPQLASVGLTDEQAIKKGIKCSCRTISFKALAKAQIIKRREGIIKMVINAQTKEILGVHILAPQAGDLIAQAMVLVQKKMTIDEVINSLPIFPTMSEAIKLVALSFKKDISKLSCCI